MDVAGEADPEDAWAAEGGESAETVGYEVKCACMRGQTVRALINALLDLAKLSDGNVAEELEGEMDLILRGPTDGVAGYTGQFLLTADDVADDFARHGKRNEGSH